MAIIDVDSFGFAYSGAHRPAVHGVSFTVEQGEIFGCLGPSGAGKSTTVIRDAREAGATIFLTTHDMVTANDLSDRGAFLVDGRIAALDAPRSLAAGL